MLKQNDEKIKYYTAFSYMLNVSPLFKAKLLEYFDFDIKRAYFATKNDLKSFKAQNEDIPISRDFLLKQKELDLDVCSNSAFLDKDVKILTVEDSLYPSLLKEIPDFPISLYYKGNLEDIDFNHTLAVVGSRLASVEAKLALNKIIQGFKNSNITIVSGLAAGIDTQAHKSAIESNLKTIGVIGSGLDIVYPSQNRALYKSIIDKFGVIISEFPLKTRPEARNFPQRNRIVVGLSKGTLVAEARLKSGAMISANLTLDYNRELMAMPGLITNPNTQGIYEIIKNGASIVTTPNDVFETLNWAIEKPSDKEKTDLSEIQKKVFHTLDLEAKNFDEIIEETEGNISEIMVTLTELEIKGLIKQLNNKYYKC